MPVDYAKWDAIELSDDEDFECHPNVDKKSMIRWKQAQVHKERRERRDQSDLLSLELASSARFLADFPAALASTLAPFEAPKPSEEANPAALVAALRSLQTQTEKTYTDPIRSESLRRIETWPREWDSPDWGPVLRDHSPWHDEVAKVANAVAKTAGLPQVPITTPVSAASPSDKDGKTPAVAPVEETTKTTSSIPELISITRSLVDALCSRLATRQSSIKKQLDSLDEIMNKKLTADHLKTGFDKTIMKKPVPGTDAATTETPSAAPAADRASKSSTKKATSTVIETIHSPSSSVASGPKPISSKIAPEIAQYEGLVDDILREFNATDAELIQLHPKLLAFSYVSDFGEILKALHANPQIQKESCEETLLIRALALEIVGRARDAKNCVINSLILKYTRSLGASGIDLFFGKLQMGKSSAHSLFFSDVDKTYEHIQNRGKILRAERVAERKKMLAERAEHEAKLKRMYESFKQPDGSLVFPLTETSTDKEREHATWFNALPHYAQEGLLLEDVEKINEFLSTLQPGDADYHAKMAVETGFIHVEEEEEEGEEDISAEESIKA